MGATVINSNRSIISEGSFLCSADSPSATATALSKPVGSGERKKHADLTATTALDSIIRHYCRLNQTNTRGLAR